MVLRKVFSIVIIANVFLLSGCGDEDVKKCLALSNDESKSLLAEDFCEIAANKGDPQAQKLFAEILLKRAKRKQAIEFLQAAANQKNGEAMYRLAELYESDKQKEQFYFQQSCDAGILKGCEKVNELNNQAKQELNKIKEELERERAIIEAKFVAAEQAKQKAEQKWSEEQQARLKAERLLQEAEEKIRLAEERVNEEKRTKAEIAKQEKQLKQSTLPVPLNGFKITQTELRQTFSDFVAEIERSNFSYLALETWVKNCYANSSLKKGCFYFDVLASITDQVLSFENKSRKTHSFFNTLHVRNRAFQNIADLQDIPVVQFDATFQQLSTDLMNNFHLFEEMQKVRKNRLAQKADPNLQKFEQNGLWGFTDQFGNVLIRPEYLAVGGFYNGRAVVKSNYNQMWGFIDTQGNWVVKPQFCMAGRFSEGLAGVYQNGYWQGDKCVGGKWGYLNTTGNWVINPIFEKAERFKNGKAKVTYKGIIGYIDKMGNWINMTNN